VFEKTKNYIMINTDTICALATAHGSGAIAVIRLSGSDSFNIVDTIFHSPTQKKIAEQKANTIHFGLLKYKKQIIDEVLVSVYKAPHSYTGENSVEISCHGSLYIQQKILNLLIKTGARHAKPGEFTQRAFLNGKMDLSQAEAVADLISSSSAASHKVAVHQMRGGFANDIKELRVKLLSFISLIELELDFSEEEVEFADRKQLLQLVNTINKKLTYLTESFELGNVIKNGIPVAIAGEPNVGKSTLLNALLNEDKAIVSDIAGTTRDAIEDVISLEGILFRFIDTAGIRKTSDIVESLGIERTMEKIKNAEIILYLIDAKDENSFHKITEIQKQSKDKKLIVVANKVDTSKNKNLKTKIPSDIEFIEISAKYKQNIDILVSALLKAVHYTSENQNNTIITNVRHF